MTYDLNWSKRAACLDQPVELFFEQYEENPVVARQIDSLCNSCPIQMKCLIKGIKLKSHGCWGGVYLVDGEISEDYNTHKTKDDWENLWISMSHITRKK